MLILKPRIREAKLLHLPKEKQYNCLIHYPYLIMLPLKVLPSILAFQLQGEDISTSFQHEVLDEYLYQQLE